MPREDVTWSDDWETAFDDLRPSVDFTEYRHALQHALNNDPSNFRVVIGTRRSGKSEELCMEGIELAEMFPGQTIPYILPTIGMGRDIVFPKMEELDEKFKIGLKINRGEYKVFTPSGGCIQLFGLATRPEAEKGRGKKFPAIICDEAGAHHQGYLKRALTQTFGPATADFRGLGGRGILVGGTPGYEPECYWEQLCGANSHISKISKAINVHFMTIFDNPFFAGREQDVIQAHLDEHGGTRSDASFRREWEGVFCSDTVGLCYQRWDGTLLPRNVIPSDGYTVLGLDLGTVHPCAWVVVRFVIKQTQVGQTLRTIHHGHVIASYEESGCSLDKIVTITRNIQKAYNVGSMVGDTSGSMAPMVIAELHDKYALPIKPVFKGRTGQAGGKSGRIWMADSMLGAGTLHIHEGCETVSRQLKTVPWNDARTDHDSKFPDHSLDALHGAISLSRQHTVEHELPPVYGSRAWADRESQKDFDRTIQYNEATSGGMH